MDSILVNGAFGKIVHLMNRPNSGTSDFDQPAWAHVPGAIIVPRNSKGQLGLIKAFRPVVWSKTGSLWDISKLDLADHGVWSLEFPRGNANAGESISDCAKREAEEETKRKAREVRLLDWTNQDTALRMFATAVVLVEMSDDLVDSEIDAKEVIESYQYFDFHQLLGMVGTGDIICGHTKSALTTFIAHFPETLNRP